MRGAILRRRAPMFRLVDWTGLSPKERGETIALDVADGDPPRDPAYIRTLRRTGYPFASYTGLYAVRDGQLCSRVVVIRLSFTDSKGTRPVTGIADVVTLPEWAGRGLATRLLKGVHRREQRAGQRWSFLWTHPSWRAHGVYEKLGYRDVYSPPVAVRRLPNRRTRELPPGYHSRPARASDEPLLSRLLEGSRTSRVGFIPRYRPGAFQVQFLSGWRRPEQHHILYHRSKPVGYAFTYSGPRTLYSAEVVVDSPIHEDAAIDLIEQVAGRDWVVICRTTFVQDARKLLEERGYRTFHEVHLTLMARPLIRVGRPEQDRMWSLFTDPRFSCHGGDMF